MNPNDWASAVNLRSLEHLAGLYSEADLEPAGLYGDYEDWDDEEDR